MNMNPNVQLTLVLIFLGILGSIAIIPYSTAMQGNAAIGPKLIVLSILQAVVLSAIAVFVGMAASRSLGLSVLSRYSILPTAILLGIAAGAIIIVLELGIFQPRLPEVLGDGANKAAGSGGTVPEISFWKRFIASFYGGITEELLMRFFLLSGLLWLVSKVWSSPEGLPLTAAF